MNTVFEHWLHISASLSLDRESSRTFQVKTFICQEFLWHPVFFHISTKKKVSWEEPPSFRLPIFPGLFFRRGVRQSDTSLSFGIGSAAPALALVR